MNMSSKGGLTVKTQLLQDIRTYWTFRDHMVVIGAIVIKGKCIVIPKDITAVGTKTATY